MDEANNNPEGHKQELRDYMEEEWSGPTLCWFKKYFYKQLDYELEICWWGRSPSQLSRIEIESD